jgi:hypothetical protein
MRSDGGPAAVAPDVGHTAAQLPPSGCGTNTPAAAFCSAGGGGGGGLGGEGGGGHA